MLKRRRQGTGPPKVDPTIEAWGLFAIGLRLHELGAFDDAIGALGEARAGFQVVGDGPNEQSSLSSLAESFHARGIDRRLRGDLDDAIEDFDRAVAIRREVGDQGGVASSLVELAKLDADRGGELALARYREALELWRAAGDLHQEGTTLALIGLQCCRLGRPRDAVDHYRKALDVMTIAADPEGECAVLQNLGTTYLDLGQPMEALQCGRRALIVARALNDPRAEGEALVSQGLALLGVGRPDDALEQFRSALSLLSEGDDHTEGIILNNQGMALADLGRWHEAVEHFRRALVRHRAANDDREEAATLSNLGMVCWGQGRLQAALERCTEALARSREVGDRRIEGTILNNMGSVYQDLGGAREARELYEQGLSIRRSVGDRQGEAMSLNNLGSVYHLLDRPGEALEHYERALSALREVGDRRGEGTTLNNMGTIYADLGRLEEAREHHSQALVVRRAVGDRQGEAMSLNNLGLIHYTLGRAQESLIHFRHGLAIAREVGDRRVEVVILKNLGVAYQSLGEHDRALESFESAVGVVEAVRGVIVGEGSRTSYFATMSDLYGAYVAQLVVVDRLAEALKVAERGKARVFLERLTESRADIERGVDPGLRQREQQMLTRLARLNTRLLEARSAPLAQQDPVVIANLASEVSELERSYDANQAEIRRLNPRYAALTQPEPWDLAMIQTQLLDERTVLLEYVLGERQSMVFVVRCDRLDVFYPLPPRGKIETQVSELRSAISGGWDRYPHSHELYQSLLAPAASLIEGKDLLIVADGALHYLPFATLLTEDSEGGTEPDPYPWRTMPYLVRDHAITYAPSATVAGTMKAEKYDRAGYSDQLVAFADPVVEPQAGTVSDSGTDLVHLPASATEVWALARVLVPELPPGPYSESFEGNGLIVRTGRAATKDAVVALTSGGHRYRYLHIASHGILDTDRPQFSGLVFTPGLSGSKLWQTFEIYNADISAELTVLSACETGLGRLEMGEGVVGLTRAFFYAGCPAVCVSLWKVADVSTPEFMVALYQGLGKGHEKAEALRAAQLHFLASEKWVHPYYWAPFVLAGDGS